MAKFRKRAIVVEALQFRADGPMLTGVQHEPDPAGKGLGPAYVVTIHGEKAHLADGDWIIAEPDGQHYYPCKPDIFAATYEPVEA